MKSMQRVALLLGVLALSACGFHLRQELVLPATLQTVRVDVADTYSPLQRNLEQAFRRAGASVVETHGQYLQKPKIYSKKAIAK